MGLYRVLMARAWMTFDRTLLVREGKLREHSYSGIIAYSKQTGCIKFHGETPMIKLLAALAVSVLIVTTVAEAQEREPVSGSMGEFALSNDTLQARFETDGRMVGSDRSRFSSAFFLSEERDIVLSAGLAFPADLNLGRLSLAVGPQVYAALLDDENSDVMSLSVGAQARFLLNRERRLAVSGHAYYAPDILTFGSADNLTDLSARVEVGLASRVIAFGGMRWFEFDLTEGEGERTLQEEVFVGFGYRF